MTNVIIKKDICQKSVFGKMLASFMNKALMTKYNVHGPRYTSYPTVPYWDNSPSPEQWKLKVSESYTKHSEKGISIYIHIPFCESLCTYCGCNKYISKNHQVEIPYIQAVIKEWQQYLHILGEKPLIKEIHLGGGTPTYLSNDSMKELMNAIFSSSRLAPTAEISIEIHPNHTTDEQLDVLAELGFNRISLGIQDFDPKVQHIVNRIQTYKQVEHVVKKARSLSFKSINFDLIYGLPLQTKKSIEDTFRKVNLLKPDRIAFYSYAHVPWLKTSQRLFTEKDLPSGEEKRQLYELGRDFLEQNGFYEIGMDHFAQAHDEMFVAYKANTLHRNFMGYTTNDTKLLIGLGCSSISDSWDCYAQNEKNWKLYVDQINKGELAITRGHILNEEDLQIKQLILDLMCQFETGTITPELLNSEAQNSLEEPIKDGFLTLSENKLSITEKGKPFVRNICMAFDKRLQRNAQNSKVFSSTV